MAIETITVEGLEAKSGSNGTFYKVAVPGSRQKLFSFDPKVSADLLERVGQTVSVDVDRTPNSEGKVFPKILSFHGEASAPAGGVAPAAASPPGGGTRAGGGDSAFKKDPVGIILGSRQTALNAAVAYLAGPDPCSKEDIVRVARHFNEFLIQGLSPFILRDGVHAKHAVPWRSDLADQENAAARAALPAPPPPPPEPEPEPTPDDDIPF